MAFFLSMNKFLIQHPIISEKSTLLAEMRKYVFFVQPGTTIPEAKKAVQAIYGVHVQSANAVSVPPKPKRYRQHRTLRSGYKKIIVTLKPGEKIDVAA